MQQILIWLFRKAKRFLYTTSDPFRGHKYSTIIWIIMHINLPLQSLYILMKTAVKSVVLLRYNTVLMNKIHVIHHSPFIPIFQVTVDTYKYIYYSKH